MVVARQEIEYLAPVPYQQHPLDVQLWFGKLGGSSMDIRYEVRSPLETAGDGGQTLYCRGATTVVKVNGASGRPVRITTEERTAWEPYLDEPVALREAR